MISGRQYKLLIVALGVLVLWVSFFAWKCHKASLAFREGVAAFYRGDTAQCEEALLRSLSLRRNKEVEAFLSEFLIDRALCCLRSEDTTGAIESMKKAAGYCPEAKDVQAAILCLTKRGLLPSSEQILQNLAESAAKPMSSEGQSK